MSSIQPPQTPLAPAGQAANPDAALLERTMLFAGLHAAHREQIFSVLQRREYAAGQVVFHEGDPGDALYIIRNGQVSVVTRNDQLGVTLELASLGPGQVFGEMALLTQERRSASVRAAAPTVCYVLSLELFRKILQQLPAVSLGIAQTLARRLGQLNKQQGIAFRAISELDFDPAVYSLVPAQLLQRHRVIPLALEGHALTLAMVDPANVMALDDLRRVLRDMELRPVAISEADYERFLREKVRPGSPARPSQAAAASGGDQRQIKLVSGGEGEEQAAEVRGAEVVELVNAIFAEGLERGASDIHIDHESVGVLVRFRVDGELLARDKVVPHAFARPLLARIKVLGGMDPMVRHLPLDGRISLSYRNHDYDLRVATMPVRRGERVTLRVLDSAGALLALDKLVLASRLAQVLEEMIRRPQGMVLVTGPTGSGKSTTLYSLLKARMGRQQSLNVVTAEDPVEYTLAGVSQVQVRESIGLTFPAVLRGFLRQDPDIILIGETRDAETARISVQAALTGHLVLTSLHTNSALESIVRLRDLGLEGYLLASALTGVVAQRLVRRNCPLCAAPRPLSQPVQEELGRIGLVDTGRSLEVKEGAGCESCKGTGFQGRVGIYEVLVVSDPVRELIAANASMADITKTAHAHGMVTLAQYADFLLKNGLTTAGEVLRVLGG